MSTTNMLIISSKRVELHPDFLAELFAVWRTGWALTTDQSEIIRRVEVLSDEGIDIAEAINLAKQQVIKDTVLNVSTPFWSELRHANSRKSNAGGKPIADSISSSPSP